MIAAAVMITVSVPFVYADDAENADDAADVIEEIPEFRISGSDSFEMWAGTNAFVNIKLVKYSGGDFHSLKCTLTGNSTDVTAEKSVRYMSKENGDLSTTFTISASPTASAETYEFSLNVNICNDIGKVIGTQTFPIKIKIKSKLQLKGLVIDNYKITKDPVRPGDKFDLEVTLRNNSGIKVKNAHLSLEGLDVTKFVLDTGFSDKYVDIEDGKTGTVKFSLIAQNGIALVRENITLKLDYSLDEKKTDLSYTTSTQVIINCEPSPEAAQYGSHDLSLVDYKTSVSDIEKGKQFTLTLRVKNNGALDVANARINVGADGSKFSIDKGLAYRDFDIKANETKTFTFDLIGCSGISSEREYIPVTVEYGSNSVMFQTAIVCKSSGGKNSEKFDLTVTSYSTNVENISTNTIFDLYIDVKNNTSSKIEKARISINDLNGQRFAVDKGLTYADFDINSGDTKHFTFRLIGCAGISSIREVIPIQIDYGEVSNITYATVKCSPKGSDGTDGDGNKVFAPNIIIENYTYGGEFVTAGQQFPLSFTIENVSSKAIIENLKVTVNGKPTQDGSIAFSPANSSNSFFFETLNCKETQTIDMDLLPKSDAVPNSYPVEIDFSYEYSVGNERYQANGISETITIPLRQEDRLVINEPELPSWGVNVGEMCTVSMSLVNKGKSAVYNVTATVEGDGFSVETPSYYIGNINSGTEEYYDAKITPVMDGEISGEIVFTYEDANGESKESRTPFTLSAMSMNFDDGMFVDDGMGYVDEMDGMNGMDMPQEGSDGVMTWVTIGGFVLAVGAIVTVIVLIVTGVKKKKAEELEDDDEDL